MSKFQEILEGGDRRSLGRANEVVLKVTTQNDFDELFMCLQHSDKNVVMRTANAIEKITLTKPKFLQKHKKAILDLCQIAIQIELKWHLALLVSRLSLTEEELGNTWHLLTTWATNKKESRIVRVNSIQGLYDLLQQNKELSLDFNLTLTEIGREKIPSINARIRRFQEGNR